ncbi:MAG: sugar phosphate nucleotidyltransferase [Dehalococcoidia bacterium]
MKAIILAGGEATRLRPLTCNTPKVMVPILNRPYLEHLADYLKRHGILEMILAVGKLPDRVQRHFGDGDRFGVTITYSTEDFPLGTAGAVKNADRFIDDSFLVFNGDILTDIDLSDMIQAHRRNRAMATLALTPVDNPTIYGVVETDTAGRVRHFTEKPSWNMVTTNMINAGIYVLERDILSHIVPETFSMFERDVFPPLLEGGHPIYGYPSHDYWIDIGTPDKYLRLHHDLLCRLYGEAVRFGAECTVHPSARIEGPAVIGGFCSIARGSFIRGPAVLGDRCHIDEGAILEGVVLWPDCRVGKGARLKNCLVASDCCIEEESEVPEGCVLGDGVVVDKGTSLSTGVKVWPEGSSDPGAS